MFGLEGNGVQLEAARNFHGKNPAAWAPYGNAHGMRLGAGSKLEPHLVPGSTAQGCIGHSIQASWAVRISDAQTRPAVGSDVAAANISHKRVGMVWKHRHNLINRLELVILVHGEIDAKAMLPHIRRRVGKINGNER